MNLPDEVMQQQQQKNELEARALARARAAAENEASLRAIHKRDFRPRPATKVFMTTSGRYLHPTKGWRS